MRKPTANDSAFPVTRRKMLGTLGAAATVGLAGCSDAIQTEFTAPIVGYPEGSEVTLVDKRDKSTFNRKLVPVDYTAESRKRPVDLPVGETTFTLNLRATTYDVRVTDDHTHKIGFLSIPIPSAGGQEFPGPLAGSIGSLVEGDLGHELFNQMGFVDRPVKSVEYRLEQEYQLTSQTVTPDLVEDTYTRRIFQAVPTFNNGETGENYFIEILRFKTQSGETLQGADSSYIFKGYGFEADEKGALIGDGAGKWAIIPEPDL